MTKSKASEFVANYNDTDDLMTALDCAVIDSDQDWENETTTWTFDDGSQVIVSATKVDVLDANA